MAPTRDLQYWTEELSRVRCRLLYALGSALSTRSSTADQTMIPDCVNDVFRVLEGFNSVNANRLESLESLLKEPVRAAESIGRKEDKVEKAKTSFAQYKKGNKPRAKGVDDETESADITKRLGEEDCIEVEVERPQCLKKDQGDEDCIDVDLQAPLRNRLRSQSNVGNAPDPVKKRTVNPGAENEGAQKGKRHKKVPCKRCAEKKREELTDDNGFFDQVAFGIWLKEEKCLKRVHVSPEVTVPRRLPLGADMYDMTFPETETLPPFG